MSQNHHCLPKILCSQHFLARPWRTLLKTKLIAATSSRRVFMMQVAAVSGALGALTAAQAQGAMVSESDAQAKSLGYVADATKTDKTKFAKYAAGQVCGNCALYQGKAADAAGGCGIFPGKQVSAKGWCSAYAKKA
ncbi:MAG: high-potential iron-sulfur protein [Burkholderiales bacterium]|nr:high-potential iron-sulfur protein [Burkholderiales bacterium]